MKKRTRFFFLIEGVIYFYCIVYAPKKFRFLVFCEQHVNSFMAFIESTFKETGFGQYTGIVCPVSNKKEIDEALKCLIEDRKIQTYCYAYEVPKHLSGHDEKNAIGCGLKLSRLLKSLDVRYCLMIVICLESRKNIHPCERVGRILRAARQTLKSCISKGHTIESQTTK